jgi:hypothetical protein
VRRLENFAPMYDLWVTTMDANAAGYAARTRTGRVPRAPRSLALLLGFALLACASSPPPAGTPEYDPRRAGHPLRIVAYVAHPIGVILDYAIFRPAWWVGSHEPFRTLFGREPVLPESQLEPLAQAECPAPPECPATGPTVTP